MAGNFSPLCVCLSTIDHCSDHLLECAHGPMYIHQHDALVDIIYHALSQCHPGVLKEQRVSGDDHSCPGDVYYPDFRHGHPAYFDILIRSTTQASYISSSSSCAGVTAAPAKDERHRNSVEETGCDFFPLVVKIFGMWSPFALWALYSVADCTITRSGTST